jgi:ubiquinone/menaquinone biosynthesis C-methylase UbiE
MDDPHVPRTALYDNLHDLRRINGYLGSTWVMRRTLHRLWRQHGAPPHWRVLDVGCGGGDMLLTFTQWGQRCGIELTSIGVDAHAGVAQHARAVLPASIAVLHADGLQLPFAAQTFDAVVCSSMLHHLDWHAGIALLRSMAHVSRFCVVVNDLLRSRLHYYIACLLLPVLSSNHLTRHDGPLSVRRAYTAQEVRHMARVAGLANARVQTVLTYRLLLTHLVQPEGIPQ